MEKEKVVLKYDGINGNIKDYLLLTNEQLALLEWLYENDYIYLTSSYEVLKHDFIEIK